MADPTPPGDSPADLNPEAPEEQHTSRMHLVWNVFVFQIKLVADGLRDVLLSPVSLIALIAGLIRGGQQPDRYFKQVLRLGRRSEIWINLFGYRKHAGTADELIDPLKEKVFSEAQNNPWVNRVGTELNKTLDNVNASIASKEQDKSGEP